MNNPNPIASIRERLRNKAAQSGEVFDAVLARYAAERLLYRLSMMVALGERNTRIKDFSTFSPSFERRHSTAISLLRRFAKRSIEEERPSLKNSRIV